MEQDLRLHTAAKNLRRLGQTGLAFTPGWTVGWYFVPFMHLYKPLQAFKEVWHASAPESIGEPGGEAWRYSPGPPGLVLVWWVTWIIAGILDRVGMRMDHSPGAGWVGLANSCFKRRAAHQRERAGARR